MWFTWIDISFLRVFGCSYQVYGDEPYIRSAENIAFHVALFIAAKNGAFVNYYMVFDINLSQYFICSYEPI